ncbi:MAG: galactose mutarotase, partial [Clostridiales bacterium]|nr:galactose mutarotase [Clostridiales bacterium]
GPNALHGGRDFYTKRLWQSRIPFVKTSARSIANAYATESLNDDWQSFDQLSMTGNTVTFCLDSPDGDQGFPGNLHVEVTYTLSNDNELHIDYKAVSDADTPLNLTNHSYFNLSGHDSGSVLLQLCEINADYVTDTDENNLPTGSMLDVSGTPMDFRQGKALGTDISADFKLIKIGSGYDHNYVLNGSGYRKVASLWSEDSGICMTVHTDLPGLQLYTANHLNDTGKNSTFYTPQCAVCFESQFFPDAVNHEDFPGGILKAGEEFTSRTTYKF